MPAAFPPEGCGGRAAGAHLSAEADERVGGVVRPRGAAAGGARGGENAIVKVHSYRDGAALPPRPRRSMSDVAALVPRGASSPSTKARHVHGPCATAEAPNTRLFRKGSGGAKRAGISKGVSGKKCPAPRNGCPSSAQRSSRGAVMSSGSSGQRFLSVPERRARGDTANLHERASGSSSRCAGPHQAYPSSCLGDCGSPRGRRRLASRRLARVAVLCALERGPAAERRWTSSPHPDGRRRVTASAGSSSRRWCSRTLSPTPGSSAWGEAHVA